MKASSTILSGLILCTGLIASSISFANPCGELIYNKTGKLRHYEYANRTMTENTKEHGTFNGSTSSSSSYSTEGSTGVFDPGVTTGLTNGYKQFFSTNGECKWFGLVLNTDEKKSQYVAQNMPEVKEDMAKGRGGHLDVLAAAYGCGNQDHEAFAKVLRQNFEKFADFTSDKSAEFTSTMNGVVQKELSSVCVATLL